MQMTTGSLSKVEVEKRLKLCEDPKVVDEVYTFGQMLMRESLQNLRSLDSKAVWFAGYGAAIITLLVSSFGAWSQFADQAAIVLSLSVALTAFAAVVYAVRAIRLQDIDLIGEAEWLKPECLSKIEFLKRFRALTMWRTIDSANAAHAYKTVCLRKSERWLYRAVVLLFATFVEMACSHVPSKLFGAWHAIFAQGNPLGFQRWHHFIGSASIYSFWLSLYARSFGCFAGLIFRGLDLVCHVPTIYGGSH